jgi:hypothetical protein
VRELVDPVARDRFTGPRGLLEAKDAVDHLLPSRILLLLGVHLRGVDAEADGGCGDLRLEAQPHGADRGVVRWGQEHEQRAGSIGRAFEDRAGALEDPADQLDHVVHPAAGDRHGHRGEDGVTPGGGGGRGAGGARAIHPPRSRLRRWRPSRD